MMSLPEALRTCTVRRPLQLSDLESGKHPRNSVLFWKNCWRIT
jgi:hypothetical protein